MNEYEFVALYHPDLEIDLDKALKKVEKIITDNGGKLTKTDNWGKRKLAYTIKKVDHAIYVYYELELPAAAVAKVESTLNITDEVIRYLISKPGPEPVEVEPKDDDDAKDDSEGKEEEKE